ncbi:MAG: EI24 domain-containing protein [Desulfobacterales bacterium]
MGFFDGIKYNFKGLKLGLKSPKLLFYGLVRFVLIAILAVVSAILVFQFYQDIFSMIWNRPESLWIVWLWHLLSWLVGLLLFAMAAMLAYLVGQVAFAVWIMDMMAQTTERIVTGKFTEAAHSSFFLQFFHLIKQEIPRTIFPIALITMLMVFGWFTPLGPILTFIMPVITALFLAWDNTDLIPARQLVPFRKRLDLLKKNLLFHMGFGLLFLIPVANILFLSFAPVGGALYHIESKKE